MLLCEPFLVMSILLYLAFQFLSFLCSTLIFLLQARCDDDDIGRFVRQDSIFTTAGFWLFFLFNILAYSAFSVTSSMGDALCFTLLGKSGPGHTGGPAPNFRPYSGDQLENSSYGLVEKIRIQRHLQHGRRPLLHLARQVKRSRSQKGQALNFRPHCEDRLEIIRIS